MPPIAFEYIAKFSDEYHWETSRLEHCCMLNDCMEVAAIDWMSIGNPNEALDHNHLDPDETLDDQKRKFVNDHWRQRLELMLTHPRVDISNFLPFLLCTCSWRMFHIENQYQKQTYYKAWSIRLYKKFILSRRRLLSQVKKAIQRDFSTFDDPIMRIVIFYIDTDQVSTYAIKQSSICWLCVESLLGK
jgi:hypothetical protein